MHKRTSVFKHHPKTVAVIAVAGLLGLTILAALHHGEPTVKEIGVSRVVMSLDGTKIAYTKLGSGPPLVLVDGAFCYRENGPSAQLAPQLAKHFTVFIYDRRGRGQSQNAQPYAIAREVEDLGAIIDGAGGSAFVLGMSSGGALALQAIASGAKVTRLAMYEPPYIVEKGRPRSFVGARKRLQELISSGDRAGAVRLFMTEIYGAPSAFVFIMPVIMRGAWKRNESVAQTLGYDLTLLDDWSVLAERRQSVAIPTLVIGGENSPKVLRDAVSTVASALPNARPIILKGQNHDISATVVVPILVDFFNSGQPLAGSRPVSQ